MTIERLPVLEIRPEWEAPKGSRYQSHPLLRMAFIQLLDEPTFIYVVTDQGLPQSLTDATMMIANWKVSCDAAED